MTPAETFADLPQLVDLADVRRVHRTDGLYLVKRGGTAHAAMDCDHLDPDAIAGKPAWRVATAAECRRLGIPWCEDCA